MTLYDVIIIGAGPGGMSAALYASRAKLKTLIIEGGIPGGQMNNTESLDNYLGTPKADAPELAEEMYEQALSFGAEEAFGFVSSIAQHRLDDYLYYEVVTKKHTYQARSVIVATGTQYRKLHIAGEEEFSGKGVSYCAVCDGPFFQDKHVSVVGGGDSALEEADYLTQFAKSVTLYHRGDTYRAKPHLQERVKENPKIRQIMNTELTGIHGSTSVSTIGLVDTLTGDQSVRKADGVFIYIGNYPQTSILSDFDVLNDDGYVMDYDPHTMMTSVSGLFAIGDIIDKPIRQVANAVGEGALAGQSVYQFLKEKERVL